MDTKLWGRLMHDAKVPSPFIKWGAWRAKGWKRRSAEDWWTNADFILRHMTPTGLGDRTQSHAPQVHLRCDFYDKAARSCTAYELRPPMCTGYPWYGADPSPERAERTPPSCGYRAEVGLPVSIRPKRKRTRAR